MDLRRSRGVLILTLLLLLAGSLLGAHEALAGMSARGVLAQFLASRDNADKPGDARDAMGWLGVIDDRLGPHERTMLWISMGQALLAGAGLAALLRANPGGGPA